MNLVFTYRYFLNRFPQLCILAVPDGESLDGASVPEPIGCVVAKVDEEEVCTAGAVGQSSQQKKEPSTPTTTQTGYIGMLAVQKAYRRRGIGKALVRLVIQRMKAMGCTSVILETEVTNKTAQRLYQESFGFIREEMLLRYYLNWNDAYRLRLWFPSSDKPKSELGK